jgi:copper oxidase (laccase) domain-containing protein
MTLRESPAPGPVPLYELTQWRERYGVVAGITARGEGPHGFDLGLWSAAPIGETMARWRAFRRAIPGFDALALGHQVHGVEVMALESGTGWIQVEGIDGWTTTSRGILLTVTVADCIPVYLCVPGRAVALLHAGWRGTAAGMLQRGVTRLAGATGAPPRDMVMHCGVGICGPCYEVGSEVIEGCGLTAEGPGPFHLDLRDHLGAEARRLGVGVITASGWCSAHDRERFYSHRRSAGADGRMVAYVGMPRVH